MLRRLITELDDTRNLYAHCGRMPLSPHAKHVVEEIVLAHKAIAEDLAEHLYTMDAKAVSRDSALGKFRARYSAWRMTAGADTEMDCLMQIERREAQIVKHFVATAEQTCGLQRRLHRHRGELERLSVHIASARDEMDTRSHVTSRAAGNPDRCPPQIANVVPKVATTPPHVNHSTPPSETPIRHRDFHAAPAGLRMAATRLSPRALDPTIMGVGMYRPENLPTGNALQEST